MEYYVEQIPLDEPFELSRLPGALTQADFHVLLESTLVNDDIGRYSIFAAFPFMVLNGFAGHSIIRRYADNQTIIKEESVRGNPLTIFNELFIPFNRINYPGLPLTGGALGYFSYELLHCMEEFEQIGPLKKEGIDIPLLAFGFFDTVVLEDRLKGTKMLISTGIGAHSREEARQRGKIKQDHYRQLIRSIRAFYPDQPELKAKVAACSPAPVEQIERSYYLESVKTIIEAIGRGEIFQACYTYQKKTPFKKAPLDLYQLLRTVNPAPYAAFMHCGTFSIVSASPERFFSVTEENVIEARPIKGTRPRGTTPEEDLKNRRELENSLKDQAENVMITDLLRNDIGKNARLGSVRVTRLFKIEEYAAVFQLVSIIQGLGKITGPDNLCRYFAGLFPGGSMTGAPKKRALELINRLEPEKRGVYSGALGYFSFNGRCDLNIVIRTAVIKDGIASIGTGGGIVYDSTPEGEYQESNHKVELILKAISYLSR